MEGKSNPSLLNIIMLLRKQKSPFWIKMAGIISKPKRKSVAVNLSKINKYSSDGDTIIVPGKVLSSGEINHKIIIAAVSASQEARKKAKIISIEEIVKKNLKGEGLKIIM